uniref:Uncharacterized protein n=1 Tax=Tanacetum cinerariifolium TaxID=118510 RepID=A0A699IJS4_TANCI|nr:hypothetical protein [Tanacetum cinerariifolium]
MNSIASQQAALDNSLVTPEKRLKIESCNARIAFTKPQKEETYQVTLEALKLSPCYPAFQITAEVPKIYMHQFWNTIKKIGKIDAYDLKLDKKKCRVDTEAMYNQKNVNYVALLLEDFMYQADNKEISSARKEHMPYPRFTKVIINHFISKDNTISMRNRINLYTVRDDSLLAYKTYLDYATGKVPPKKARKYPPDKSVSKKKAPAKADRGKGIELLYDAALLKDAQLKKTLRKSKRETHKLQASGSSEGADFKSEDDSEDESDDVHDEDDNNDDDGNDDDSGNDDGGNDAQDSKRTDSDDDENASFTLKYYEEEGQDEEYEFYGDLNITHEIKDTDMTNVEQGEEDRQNASHESGFKQEEYDGHVTLMIVHDKTKGTMQSSSVSSDFTSKLLNLDNTCTDVNEIASLMNTSTVPPLPPPINPSPHLITITLHPTPDSTTTTTNPTISLPKIPNFAQFAETVSSIPSIVDNYLASKLKEKVNVAVRLQSNKLREEAQAENQEFLNQVNSTMNAIIKEQVQTKVTKIMPQIKKYVIETLGAEVLSTQAEEPVFEAADTDMQYDQGNEFGHPDDQPDNETAMRNDWYKKPKKPPTSDHPWNKRKAIDFRPPQTWISNIAKTRQPPRKFDELLSTPIDFSAYVMNNLKIDNLTEDILNNPDGHAYPFNLSKPLLLIKDRGRQVVPANYFINKDLEYLKGGSKSSKYTTSIIRTKAARVKVMRWYDYGYLEEIEVRRDDNVLYKFKEGDFLRLNLCDIEDMLLLLVQKKLSNLDINDRYDLKVALRMFTRCIVILHRVKDLQLGVESYQKKLNVTRPETFRLDVPNMIPYTSYKNPQGIIYQDKFVRNRLMRSDKLYKFCDGTLSSVRMVLHDIASNLEMDYLPKRH